MKDKQVPVGKKFIAGVLLDISQAFILGMEKSSTYHDKKIAQAYAEILLRLAKRELK
jgi:hypothetical protein